MKAHKLFFLCSMLILAGCQTMTFDEVEDNAESTTKGSKTMFFRITGFSMTNLDESEHSESRQTRASSVQNATDHLLLGIYDQNGHIVDSIIYQDKDDTTESYGTFSHTLEYGKYTILALGWNGNQECHVHSLDSIYFSENWVPNTFLCRQNIIVNESYSNTRTLSMRRCIARFVINFKDEIIPQEIGDFVIKFLGAGNTLNSETRHCSEIQEFSRKIDVNIEPSKIKSLTTNCFLPSDSASIGINVLAHSKSGEVIAEREFTEVPMKINYSTNYTGNFFPFSSISETVTFEIDFDGEFNVDF